MNLFKLLFKFNPSKLQLIPAERLTPKMRDEIATLLDDVSEQITKKDLDVTPSQLEYLKNQGDEIAKYDSLKTAEGIELLQKPKAEIIAPLDFGKAPKTDLKKVRARVDSIKENIQDLADNDQIPVKVIDQFRDENTLTNLYRTQEQALAGGDINTSRKIQKQIDAIIKKEPFGDGFAAGGIVKIIKKILSADDLKKLAKKENIHPDAVDRLLRGDIDSLPRGQARGLIKRDKEGNIFIKDKYSEKYDPIRKQPVTEDDPGMFDDMFDKMFGEYEYDMYKKSGRKPMASGGLAKLLQMTRRGFLKVAGATGIAAATGGKLRKAKKVKEGRDMQIVLTKNFDDGDYVGISAAITPRTKEATEFLEKMVKQKKVERPGVGTYYVDLDDFTDLGAGDVRVFKDIKDKDFKVSIVKRSDMNADEIEPIDDLRGVDSPLTDENRNYGASSGQFEDDAAEYFADTMQPKSIRQKIEERLKKVEIEKRMNAINKRYKQNKADGGLATLFAERG